MSHDIFKKPTPAEREAAEALRVRIKDDARCKRIDEAVLALNVIEEAVIADISPNGREVAFESLRFRIDNAVRIYCALLVAS